MPRRGVALMLPQTPDQIREWQVRLGLTDAQAATALRLGNVNTIMRQYKSSTNPKEPAPTTRSHMDLLEEVIRADAYLRVGLVQRAGDTLRVALEQRLGPRDATIIS